MKRMIPDITRINFVLSDEMAYETPDDFNDNGDIILYSGMNKTERLAVGVHAFIEFILAKLQGVTAKQITKWDTEKNNGAYDQGMYDKDAQYKAAHEYAELVEHKIVEAAGMDWEQYSEKILAMKIKWNKKAWKGGEKK